MDVENCGINSAWLGCEAVDVENCGINSAWLRCEAVNVENCGINSAWFRCDAVNVENCGINCSQLRCEVVNVDNCGINSAGVNIFRVKRSLYFRHLMNDKLFPFFSDIVRKKNRGINFGSIAELMP